MECAPGCGPSGDACPLVVALHGSGDNDARKFRLMMFGYYYPMFKQGRYCMLFATAVDGGEWNVGPNSPDMQHIVDTTNTAIRNYNIDANAVFLMGYSRGGLAAYLTVCTNHRQTPFSAIAVASIQVAESSEPGHRERFCCPNPNFHLLHAHGTADTVSPYYDHVAWGCATAPEIVEKHGKSDNRCSGPQVSRSKNMANTDIIDRKSVV